MYNSCFQSTACMSLVFNLTEDVFSIHANPTEDPERIRAPARGAVQRSAPQTAREYSRIRDRALQQTNEAAGGDRV